MPIRLQALLPVHLCQVVWNAEQLRRLQSQGRHRLQRLQQRQQTLARQRLRRVGRVRCAVGDGWPVVGIDCGAKGKMGQRLGSGHEAAQQCVAIGQLQAASARLIPRFAQALFDPVRRHWCAAGVRDQTQHWRIEAVRGQHGQCARIHAVIRAHDAAQRLQVELMQRQPLAKQATRLQACANRGKMLDRVQGAAARRMEQIGHDYIVLLAGCAHVAARVGCDDGGHAGARLNPVSRLEMGRRSNHFRQQFDNIDAQPRIFGRSCGGHAGAQTEEQRIACLVERARTLTRRPFGAGVQQ